jgi:hypothetical protein
MLQGVDAIETPGTNGVGWYQPQPAGQLGLLQPPSSSRERSFIIEMRSQRGRRKSKEEEKRRRQMEGKNKERTAKNHPPRSKDTEGVEAHGDTCVSSARTPKIGKFCSE